MFKFNWLHIFLFSYWLYGRKNYYSKNKMIKETMLIFLFGNSDEYIKKNTRPMISEGKFEIHCSSTSFCLLGPCCRLDKGSNKSGLGSRLRLLVFFRAAQAPYFCFKRLRLLIFFKRLRLQCFIKLLRLPQKFLLKRIYINHVKKKV